MAAGQAMQRWAPWAYVGPALLWTAAFFVLPLLVMVWVSLTAHGTGDGLSLANYTQFVANESYRRALVASLEVTVVVTLVSVVLAYPFAWFLAEIVPERWQRLGLMLAVLPFWTSYVVRSYSWLLVLAENGVVNKALVGIGLLSEPVQIANTRFATITGFVHFFVMLLTLTIFANLKQLSPELPQGRRRSRRERPPDFPLRGAAADAARHHGRRLSHLRAGDRRLRHAADPRRQQRAADAPADHDADRPARRLSRWPPRWRSSSWRW